MARVRPDYGPGFQVKVLKHVPDVPSLLGSGQVLGGLGVSPAVVYRMMLHRRNVKRFRAGLVCKAHRLVYHSTLGLGVIKKKKK